MEVAVVLANTSPSIALGGGLEELAKKLKEILPNLRRAAEGLRRVEEKYCRPLLLVEPAELGSYFKSMGNTRLERRSQRDHAFLAEIGAVSRWSCLGLWRWLASRS